MRNWDEFKEGTSEWPAELSRRDFIELAGASLALMGLVGCTRAPHDKVYPYVDRPENTTPGKPLFYASARTLGGLAHGILVETHEGRPTKIEGNPDHPASLGSASAWQQASVLSLYDPDRAKRVLFKNQVFSWSDFIKAWEEIEDSLQNEPIVLVTEVSSSPSLHAQIDRLKQKFHHLQWIQWEPQYRTNSLLGAQQSLGAALSPVYNFAEAQVVLSLDADFLAGAEYPVSYARDFMKRRRAIDNNENSNQLFVAETAVRLTGLKAQSRVTLSSSELENLAVELVNNLEKKSEPQSVWLKNLVLQIEKHQGNCAFIAGPEQSVAVHSIAHFLNVKYGDRVVHYTQLNLPSDVGLQNLTAALKNQKVKALFVVGANLVYGRPHENWSELIEKVPFSLRLSLHEDETSQVCQWQLPMSDEFEAWSDSQNFDGSLTVIQPAVSPLYETHNIHELLSILEKHQRSSYEIVKSHWKNELAGDFTQSWPELLKKGLHSNFEKISALIHLKSPTLETKKVNSELEAVIKPSFSLYDGRFANNAWLQELPDPLTKVTWENVICINSNLAKDKKIVAGQLVEVKIGEKKIEGPAWILNELGDQTILLSRGYGRTHIGKIGQNIGYSVGLTEDFASAQIRALDRHVQIACTQTEQKMDARDPSKDSLALPQEKHTASLYPEDPTAQAQEPAWAMTIDLDSCTGCAACMIACQSENNIPVVGKKMVLMGRAMHWIRVDRYEGGDFQPIPCMHCEKAPCEVVCPVAATTHGNGGLNQMVYNRCVGTRYCANNCPYKVRRFNFFNYTEFSDLERLQKNPDVSIRPRGVMEKCTYCVQRINQKSIEAKIADRPIQDEDIQTACQQTCPTQAITFGNMKDPHSKVSQAKKSPRNYSLLEELGTRPRTTYLARVPEAKV